MAELVAFDIKNWFWFVTGGSLQNVFSSAAGDYIPTSSAAYTSWIASGGKATHIASEADLGAVLAPTYTRPVNANVLAAYQTACANNLDLTTLTTMYDHESRIRTLAGQGAITLSQFKQQIAGLM